MVSLNQFVAQLSGIMWGPWLLILLVGTGIFLTVRLRGIQFRLLFYALFNALGAFGISNMLQANTTAEAVSEVFGIGEVPVGVVLAVLTAMVILGGIKRIADVSSVLHPPFRNLKLGAISVNLISIGMVRVFRLSLIHQATDVSIKRVT